MAPATTARRSWRWCSDASWVTRAGSPDTIRSASVRLDRSATNSYTAAIPHAAPIAGGHRRCMTKGQECTGMTGASSLILRGIIGVIFGIVAFLWPGLTLAALVLLF